MKKMIGLRCDVDFSIGLKVGVPNLLEIFSKRNIKTTFYVTMGPDGFRNNIFRVKDMEYIKRINRMKSTEIIRKFGIGYVSRQLIGVPTNVGESNPEILKLISKLGHEIGVHGFDHYWWAENIWNSPSGMVELDLTKSLDSMSKILGFAPYVTAAPNWRCSIDSLKFVDRQNLPYSADTRGRYPFFPIVNGVKFETPQIPISLPCLHEISNYLDSNDLNQIIDEFIHNLGDSYNVWCIHDYYEGILKSELFTRVLDRVIELGYEIVPIMEIYNNFTDKLTFSEIIKLKLPGGRGLVSFQNEN